LRSKVKAVRPAEAKMPSTLETSMCEKRQHFGVGSLSRSKVKAVRPAEAKMPSTLETSMCEKRPHFGVGSLLRSKVKAVRPAGAHFATRRKLGAGETAWAAVAFSRAR
jgi:hypothetical protein